MAEILDAVIDSLPGVGGKLLQAVTNTQGYQDEQARRSFARESMARQKQDWAKADADYEANASIREAARMGADEYKANADLRESDKAVKSQSNKEYMNDAEFRQQRARMNLETMDRVYKESQMKVIQDNKRKEWAQNPELGWNVLSVPEQEQAIQSPRLQAAMETAYYARNLIKAKQGDTETWERSKRELESNGGKVIEDGKGNYTLEIYGRSIPMNHDTLDQLNGMVNDQAQQEIRARQELSVASTNGNPMGRILAKNAEKLMPYMGNDAVQATQHMQKMLTALPEGQRNTMILRRAVDDFFDSTITTDAKMKGLSSVVPLLQRMGFNYEMPDENPMNARIIDPINKKTYSLTEFKDYLKENDVATSMMDKQAAGMKAQYEDSVRRQQAKDMYEAARYLREQNKNKKGEEENPEASSVESDLKSKSPDEWDAIPEAKREKVVQAVINFNYDRDRHGYESTNDVNTLIKAKENFESKLKAAGVKATSLPFPYEKQLKSQQDLMNSIKKSSRENKEYEEAQKYYRYLRGEKEPKKSIDA